MGEDDDESFAANAAVVSFVDSSSSTGGDANQDSFLALLVKCYYQNLLHPLRRPSMVASMLKTLVTMQLNLPENAEARESISRTNIIECLVKTMATPKLDHPAFVYAARLMGDLISGNHTKNIKECYKCGALPVLVDNLSPLYGGHCAPVLKLLRIDDNPQQNAECLLDFSSVSTILNAMKARPDLHEWSCSRLHYVLAGWEKHCPGEDAGEAFLKNGAIDAILNAIFQIPNATVTGGGQGPDRLGSAPAPAPNPAPAPKASSFNFGQASFNFGQASFNFGQAPAPAPASAGGFTFGNTLVPAPSSTSAGVFTFGGAPPAPAPSSRTGGFTVFFSASQEEAMPRILADPRRIPIGQAQSGSGKAAAFTLGMLYLTVVDTPATTQALCVTPTRELAIHIFEKVVKPMACNMTGLKVQLAVAGTHFEKGQKCDAHIIIGTPGKVVDWMMRRIFNAKTIKVFVLDEADSMIEEGGHRANSLLIKKNLQDASFFGSTPAPAPFGTPAPAPTSSTGGIAFGSAPVAATLAGDGRAPAPAPSGGLFGSSTTGFAASPAPGFGSSAFGSATSIFGAPAPGLFGAPAPSPAFGSTFGSTGTTFGSPAAAPTGFIFGSPAPAPGQPGVGGTKGTPFQVTSRQDGTSSISMQSISAMSAYKNKSFEELRYEDYLQGNKGGANDASTPTSDFGTFGAFGTPAPSAFGAAPAPAPFSASGAFGAPAPSAFGSPAPAPFAAPAPSAFGFGKPASNSLFGAPAPAPTSGNRGSAAKPILPGTRSVETAATIWAGSVGTAATIREACKCILILVSKSPGICSNLLKKGAVIFLGAALQKQWPKDTIDVHGHCQQALLAVLGSPM